MSDRTLEPFEWIEIDQDFCAHNYGEAPCTATLDTGGSECFNTRSTCQDPANYEKGVLTLRFCKNQAFLPEDAHYIPSLVSARSDAGSINPVGANSASTALGTRGGLSVELQDHPHTDKLVDPYLANRRGRDATYIATERGTFWSKWRARNAYYIGRPIRYKTGFIDTATREVVNVVTRTYFITGFDGPNGGGRVTFQARDLLSQVSNEKAKAPLASTGKLLNDITADQTEIQLDPVGIGDDEYDLAGVCRIGAELCTYTRAGGSDALTVVRGRYNTEAKEAKAGDIVQNCLVFNGVTPTYLLELFLSAPYGGIDPAYLDTAQWAQEQTDYMPRLYSGVVAAPTGVLDLIAEMCQQMYFYPVWDERTATLKIRAIRPADGDEVKELDDFSNLIQDSVSLKDLNEQLITQVWVFYGLLNPAGNLTDDSNYAVREIIATDEGLPEKQDVEKIKKIYCRWIPSTNGAAAVDLGEKMLARYAAPPRQASFMLAEKDSSLWLGDFVRLNTRLSVDATGAPKALNLQVMSAGQDRAGVLFRYVAQEFVYEKPTDPNERLIVIAADQVNVNLRELHDSLYAAPTGGETINVVIRSGVVIGARGAEDIETYSGLQRLSQTTTYQSSVYNWWRERVLSPLMLRECLAREYRAHDTDYINGADTFKLSTDLWIVPCSVALDTGDWPDGVQLNLLVESGAMIVGEGGYSSQHGGIIPAIGSRKGLAFGSDGGHALLVRQSISINNQGTIGGGGGGGIAGIANAGGRGITGTETSYYLHPSGSGAGRWSNPTANEGVPGGYQATVGRVVHRQASPGDLLNGGYGSIVEEGLGPNIFKTTAGNGGALAQNGTNPLTVVTHKNSYPIYTPVNVSYGGRAGYAIAEGASLITWINKGDVRGAEID